MADLVCVITFRKIVPMTQKWARKPRLAIRYNLREKSGAKSKNCQSYSNPRDKKKKRAEQMYRRLPKCIENPP